jgi:hypothetical protein
MVIRNVKFQNLEVLDFFSHQWILNHMLFNTLWSWVTFLFIKQRACRYGTRSHRGAYNAFASFPHLKKGSIKTI